jgi:hypothetical protein
LPTKINTNPALAGPELPERARRLVVAADAKTLGRGGIAFVHKASGISRVTIKNGINELDAGMSLPKNRNRRPGGGRKKMTTTDPTVLHDLQSLVADSSRGDPESPLLWTIKSTRTLAHELVKQHHAITHTTVATLLKEADYRLQANSKTHEGRHHPDRDAQFQYINARAQECLTISSASGIISVDTKKKELVGNYKNNGHMWLPKGQPCEVNMHDFPDRDHGKAVPYGIYDMGNNHGYINVGINHDTGEFAVASIRRWWQHLGHKRYPNSQRLLITADAGGSNGYRLRLWKVELQKFADATDLTIIPLAESLPTGYEQMEQN